MRMTADIVFPRQHLAVFIDGCFWHGCPIHYAEPTTNEAYWHLKIDRNRTRDRRTDEALHAAGWVVVRVWEHDDPEAVTSLIISSLDAARSYSSSAGTADS